MISNLPAKGACGFLQLACLSFIQRLHSRAHRLLDGISGMEDSVLLCRRFDALLKVVVSDLSSLLGHTFCRDNETTRWTPIYRSRIAGYCVCDQLCSTWVIIMVLMMQEHVIIELTGAWESVSHAVIVSTVTLPRRALVDILRPSS